MRFEHDTLLFSTQDCVLYNAILLNHIQHYYVIFHIILMVYVDYNDVMCDKCAKTNELPRQPISSHLLALQCGCCLMMDIVPLMFLGGWVEFKCRLITLGRVSTSLFSEGIESYDIVRRNVLF